jgi:hypothetical protein
VASQEGLSSIIIVGSWKTELEFGTQCKIKRKRSPIDLSGLFDDISVSQPIYSGFTGWLLNNEFEVI